MGVKDLKVLREDEKGAIYYCDKLVFIYRKKGTVSGNHKHKDASIFYLVEGKAEFTLGDKDIVVDAPAKIEAGPEEYHKVTALTDIYFLEDIKKEDLEEQFPNLKSE